MKKFFLYIVLLTGFTSTYAQTNCTVKKANAYYNVSMPGVQMADENGNLIPPKPYITRFIYVEYSGAKAPEIKSVLYNNVLLNHTVAKVKGRTVSIGDKELNSNNTITAKKGNSFLKINLQLFEGEKVPETDCKNIIIKSKVAGNICKFFVGSEKEFAAPPRY